MRFPFFKQKVVIQPPAHPDENTQKFVDRVLELCQKGKLQWYQIPPGELYERNSTGFAADYKELKIWVIPNGLTTSFQIRNKNGATVFGREIRHRKIPRGKPRGVLPD